MSWPASVQGRIPQPVAPIAGKSDWAEYTADNGRKYYFNKATGLTTWDKPNELKSATELALSLTPWKEYIADNGKKYYYNSATKETTWEEPTDLRAIREAKETDMLLKKAREEVTTSPVKSPPHVPTTTTTITTSPTPEESKDGSSHLESVYKTQEERVQAFKDLLDATGVTTTWTWDMTMRAIINDERYKLIKTLSEKKQILQEYQAEKRRLEREEKRKKEERAKEAFLQMLRESDHISARMAWRKAAPYFAGDLRYETVPERDREDLFERYMIEMENQEKELIKQKRREIMQRFRQRLDSDPSLNVNSQWRKVKEQYKDDETYLALEKLDRLTVFEDFIRDLEKDQEDKKRLEQQEKKKQSRKNRESYRGLLQEKYKEGLITLETRWKDLHRIIRDDPRYRAMVDQNQTGSLASEIFGDFLDDLEEQFYRQKKKVKEMLKQINFNVTPQTKQDELIQSISNLPEFESVEKKNLYPIAIDIISKAVKDGKKQQEENEKRHRKAVHNFYRMLESASKVIRLGMPWSEARKIIMDDPAFQAIESEEERESMYSNYMAKRREDESDEEGRIMENDKRSRSHRGGRPSSKRGMESPHHDDHRDMKRRAIDEEHEEGETRD